jgi:hypothetical protein
MISGRVSAAAVRLAMPLPREHPALTRIVEEFGS